MDKLEVNEDLHMQADKALTFLDYTRLVQFGSDYDIDEGDAPGKVRDLTMDEENVKGSALTRLLEYFVKDFDFIPGDEKTNRARPSEKSLPRECGDSLNDKSKPPQPTSKTPSSTSE